jgi:cyclic-di-AMP phosphodiesterase PgpH
MKKNTSNNIISWKFPKNRMSGYFADNQLMYAGLFLLVFLSLTSIMAWKYFPSIPYKDGVVSPRDVLAPNDLEVINVSATIEAQSIAMNSVEPVYIIDPAVISALDNILNTQFEKFKELRIASYNNTPLRIKELKSELPVSISDVSLHTFLNAPPGVNDQMEILSRNLVNQAMQRRIRENDIDEIRKVRQEVRNSASLLPLPPEQRDAIAELASETIRPNSRVNWEETARLRQQRKDSVKPVTMNVRKGQVIVSKGQIITPEHIQIFESMGLQRARFNGTAILGIFIFVILCIFIVWRYIQLFAPEIVKSPSILLLLVLIVSGIVLLGSLLVQFNPYWAPVPVASILIAILIQPRIAMLITIFISIIIGILTGEIHFAAVPLITGLASVISVWNVKRRLDLITASLMVFAVNVLSVLFFSLIYGDSLHVSMENLVYAGINGFSSGIVAIGLLPLLEYAFRITTSIKLLELSNQSEPLLKKLLLEAPGTYHHSIIVGNLAESAAEVIGEDPLLYRVASYYHDIGKLKRPYFFIENQLGSDNPHEKLSPNLSALIIIAHTKDGLELGRQHHLPEPILDVIVQHHGTTITQYFYYQAQKENKEAPRESDFRYPGPKPQNRASAVIMLADAVEAAARTIKNPTPQKIEELVNSVFEKFLDDDQFDECPLSMKNIRDLKTVFSTVLTGIYHHRIEYPEQIMKQLEKNDETQIEEGESKNLSLLNRQAE